MDEKTPTQENYHQNLEIEGKPTLVSIDTEDVDASGVDDDSTGMEGGDFLGRTNKEE